MSCHAIIQFATAACLACCPALAGEGDWPRFRGTNGDGIGRDAFVPAAWTSADYNWRVSLAGVGHSSPVVWGQRVFTISGDAEQGHRTVECFDADGGDRLWSKRFDGAPHGKHQHNSYASATPAVDDHAVYVCWAAPTEFVVLALDHDGQELWRVDLGPYESGHGFGSSPIVCDDLIIVPNEQSQAGAIVALDRRDGRVRWKAERPGETTWYTPCLWGPADGRPQIVVISWNTGIAALDSRDGRMAWRADVFAKGHVEAAIGSPIVAGDHVLGVCGWMGVRQEVVAVRPGAIGPGDATPVAAFTIDRGAPLVTTPLVKDDLLFLWADNGVVTCADARTGEVHWRQRVGGNYYASPVWCDGRLVNVSMDGEAVVLSASAEYEELGRSDLGEGSHSTPAIARGRMYLRTFGHLMSLGGAAPVTPRD
jgi:outer membrane protein assembly factor BamB